MPNKILLQTAKYLFLSISIVLTYLKAYSFKLTLIEETSAPEADPLFRLNCKGMSADGKKIVFIDRENVIAYLWTEENGLTRIENAIGPFPRRTGRVHNISISESGEQILVSFEKKDILWTENIGIKDITCLRKHKEGGACLTANAHNIFSYGATEELAYYNATTLKPSFIFNPNAQDTIVIKTHANAAVGYCEVSESLRQAFYWTESKGLRKLSTTLGNTAAMSISANQEYVIGNIAEKGFLWNLKNNTITHLVLDPRFLEPSILDTQHIILAPTDITLHRDLPIVSGYIRHIAKNKDPKSNLPSKAILWTPHFKTQPLKNTLLYLADKDGTMLDEGDFLTATHISLNGKVLVGQFKRPRQIVKKSKKRTITVNLNQVIFYRLEFTEEELDLIARLKYDAEKQEFIDPLLILEEPSFEDRDLIKDNRWSLTGNDHCMVWKRYQMEIGKDIYTVVHRPKDSTNATIILVNAPRGSNAFRVQSKEKATLSQLEDRTALSVVSDRRSLLIELQDPEKPLLVEYQQNQSIFWSFPPFQKPYHFLSYPNDELREFLRTTI